MLSVPQNTDNLLAAILCLSYKYLGNAFCFLQPHRRLLMKGLNLPVLQNFVSVFMLFYTTPEVMERSWCVLRL